MSTDQPAAAEMKESCLNDLGALADDYSDYLKVDCVSEAKLFEDNIDDLLTRLDEYCVQIELIRGDCNIFLDKDIAVINQKCKEMENIFEKIDKLEKFVHHVRENMDRIERQVVAAEQESSKISNIRHKLKTFNLPFFQKKNTPAAHTPSEPFLPSPVYKTSEFVMSPAQNSFENPNYAPSPTSASVVTDPPPDTVDRPDTSVPAGMSSLI